MALVTHQVQGTCSAFTLRPLLWNRGRDLKKDASTLPMVKRTDRFLSLRCSSCLSIGALLALRSKGMSFKVVGFKGISQSNESGFRATGSKSLKNLIRFSYLSQDKEDAAMESPNMQNIPVCYTSKTGETIAGSSAIKELFKHWLILLRMPSSKQVVEQNLEGEGPLSSETLEPQNRMQTKERGEALKATWWYFLGLDATIKLPLVIFVPWYLAINVIYGTEVSMELTPLWVSGPLVVALYVKLFRALCVLYVFSFKETAKIAKSFPTYYLLAYGYIAHGKLKEDIRACILQPVDLDYIVGVCERKVKDLEGWLVKRCLDFVESIWPYYCRTIRFLKRANLIKT